VKGVEGRAGTVRAGGWIRWASTSASNLGLEAEDFNYGPFDPAGGLGKVSYRLAATCTTLAA
jgi:hypothetical protein